MIEFQRKLLGDRIRNDALFRALKATVAPSCTVTDIGSGTGFLSFLTLKLGARHCYLYETSHDLLTLSKRIARANGLHRGCTFVHAHSRDIRSPMKTDIVISETLGNFAYEEHIIETMNDAQRFFKPGGTLIPQMLRQYIAPVTTDRLWMEINIWDSVMLSSSKHGTHRRRITLRRAQGGTEPQLSFAAAKEVALNNMYVKIINPHPALSLQRERETREWDSIDFTKKNSSRRTGTATWNIQQGMPVYGFALWWECDLVPGITLSTSPFAKPTHWEQIFLPLLSPITAKKGDCLTCAIASDSNHRTGLNVTWETTLHSGKRHVMGQQQELRKGMIFP